MWMDVNQDLKLLWTCKKKSGSGRGGGVRGGCEPRIEVIVKMQKEGRGIRSGCG